MDIKSKKSKNRRTAFFTAVGYVAFFIALFCLTIWVNNNGYRKSFLETDQFRNVVYYSLTDLAQIEEQYEAYAAKGNDPSEYPYYSSNLLSASSNGNYFVFNTETKFFYTNTSAQTVAEFESTYGSFSRSRYYLKLQNGLITGFKDGGPTMPQDSFSYSYEEGFATLFGRNESSYAGASSSYGDTKKTLDDIYPNLQKSIILFSVNQELFSGDQIYTSYFSFQSSQYASALGVVACIIWAVSTLYVIFHYRYKLENDRSIAKSVSWIWVEIKALLLFISFIPFIICLGDGSIYGLLFSLLILSPYYYALYCDLKVNRSAFFKHNSVTSIMSIFSNVGLKYEFQVRLKSRILLLIALECILICLAILFFFLGFAAYNFGVVFFLLCIFTIAIGVALIISFYKKYLDLVTQLGNIIGFTEEIKEGKMSSEFEIEKSSDLYPLANNLTTIRSGIKTAVENQIQSERMKVELITNVSHDLKTPLTSIINYVDLLKKEELQPEYANDYVNILEKKATRLKTLVQDLFDVSKANSGDIQVDIECLDVGELLQQTLAEMDERIAASELEFRVRLPEEKLFIDADGNKLFRVFENLIVNTLKYAMPSTRVYVECYADEGKVYITFKNVSSYEMHFTGSEIVQRFVRGDESRGTEGSGLGLAIAKSFLSIQGGRLRVDVDGDMFKAIVIFDQEPSPYTTLPSETPKEEE